MKIVDQIGHAFFLESKPKKIISVVPSQTELLFDLGLGENIVGITKFCIHPKERTSTKTKIGGTKNLDIEKIRDLQPDIIFANKEENTKEQIEILSQEFNVWTSDISHFETAIQMILMIGDVTGKSYEAEDLSKRIKLLFDSLPLSVNKTCIYLIWNKPIMTIGGDTFINDMLCRAGYLNLTENKKRYPTISEANILELKPDVLFLSSEPYPYSDEHLHYYKTILHNTQIILVDGELFSWYGSRMLHAPLYFSELRRTIENAL